MLSLKIFITFQYLINNKTMSIKNYKFLKFLKSFVVIKFI